jgi:hypothetical protein
MNDDNLTRSLTETRMGAVALGLCIARTLGQSDPTILQKLADAALAMSDHLCKQDRIDAAQIVNSFALALANPDKSPLFNPPD